jgi:hypothetical protein
VVAAETETQFAMAQALFARSDRGADGRRAFAHAYPHAPAAMLDTAVHHLLVDGCAAALAFLAEAERFLRDPSTAFGEAASIELLDHVYNWHQFRALMPGGTTELLALVAELQQHVSAGDLAATAAVARALADAVEGNLTPPAFE